jgi:ubiquinone biosynthesis protein COQ9
MIKDLLNITPFPGWQVNALYPHVSENITRLEFDALFPYGSDSLIKAYRAYLDTRLIDEINPHLPSELGTTDTIRWIVRTRFQHILQHAEAEKAAISEALFSANILTAPIYIGQFADLVWRAVGDMSTDMNYYTKRLSLGVVYSLTLLHWYHTQPTSIEEIMAYFNARLSTLKSLIHSIPTSENIVKNLNLLKAAFFNTF